jgi:hypothetical protein
MHYMTFWTILSGAALAGLPQQPVNPDWQIQQDFEKRVEAYVKLRGTAREALHKLIHG